MKKIDSIKITALDDKQSVQNAFDEYFEKPNAKSALKVVYCCARQMMVDMPVQQITLEFEKMSYSASYNDGKITISLASLKKCKKPEYITEILISLFHEYSHAITEHNNKLVLANKSNCEYLQPYYEGLFYNFFNKVLQGDMEMASACSMYYYYFNKNEDKARFDSSEMTQKYVNEFCRNRNLKVKSYKELNDKVWSGLFDVHKELRYNSKLPIIILNNYQAKFIEKLPYGVTEQELDEFLLSVELNLTPKARETLIDVAIKMKNIDYTKKVLSKPQIKVTNEELKQLKQLYGADEISKLVFSEFKMCGQENQISK